MPGAGMTSCWRPSAPYRYRCRLHWVGEQMAARESRLKHLRARVSTTEAALPGAKGRGGAQDAQVDGG